MKCLLLSCWCFSVLGAAGCFTVHGYSCLTSFWNSVSCVLNVTGEPADRIGYRLEFIELDGGDNASCQVAVANHSFGCDCRLLPGSEVFGYEQYRVSLCLGSRCAPVTDQFDPPDNIQPTPPRDAAVRRTAETFNISWENGYENHPSLGGRLHYQVLLQTPQSPRDKIIHPEAHEPFVLVQRRQLEPDVTYCVSVRSEPGHHDYSGTWSEWGPSTCWRTEAGEEKENTLLILSKSVGPVLLAAGVLLFIFYCPTVRMKIKTLSHTPSPAPFFQPLFQQHDGNLQDWLSPRGGFVPYKTEEVLKTDSVIVVLKPAAKDPDEPPAPDGPPGPRLVFTQCQSSYVGLPGLHEAPPHAPAVSPADTSYTQLPLSVWGVASSPPKDFCNFSRSDSGCGCDDLTPSPECSLPGSPVGDSPPPPPPPCVSTGYCVLNKTAGGFAPALVSRGDIPPGPAEPLHRKELRETTHPAGCA